MSEPNYLINSVLKWFTARPLAIVLVVVVFIALLMGGVDSCRSRKYDKQRAEFEAQSKDREARMSQLEGENAQLRARMADLEPKALAFTAIVDSKIKVDETLKDRIEKVTEDAANAESIANQPAACRDRAARICSLFRATDSSFNCAVIYADCPRQ